MDPAGQFNLCDVCGGFDFSPYGPSSHDSYDLGTAADIAKRRSCVFCAFISTNFLSGSRPLFGSETRFPDAVKVRLRRDGMGWIHDGENHTPAKDKLTEAVTIFVSATKSRGSTVCLAPCVIPIPSVQDYCNSAGIYLNRAARSFSSRSIEPTVGIKLPWKWLRLCREAHGDSCENPDWIQPHEQPINIRLIDVHDWCVAKARPGWSYVCLSYVWGESALQAQAQATRDTIHDLERPMGLKTLNLSRTILDAIQFVQDMGERYLWVDCLCILQDDEREKSTQINQMDLIYARALLTLAVVAGQDCDNGIPHLYRKIRKPQQNCVQISHNRGLMISKQDGMYKDEEKWATRGWTYQELHLSRRTLMVFAEMLHWRCECDYWNETTCLEPSKTSSEACISYLPRSLGLTFFRPRFELENLPVHAYYYNADREFKNDGDALDAFKGILKRMEQVSGTKFHWALPRRYFHHSLLWARRSAWYRQDRRRKGLCKLLSCKGNAYTTQLPSWSWIGWYVALQVPSYSAEEAEKFIGESSVYETDWAAEWFGLDTNGKLFKLEQSSWHEFQRYRAAKQSQHQWAGDSLEHDDPSAMPIRVRGNDTGCIVAWTSYARCKIRSMLYDDISRREGKEPVDSHEYKLLGRGERVLGLMHSIDLVSPVESYDEARLKEEEAEGRWRDFIVISRQKGWSTMTNMDDHHSSVLNLMMIQWEPNGSNMASRLGIFQMPEECWMETSPEWRKITLC